MKKCLYLLLLLQSFTLFAADLHEHKDSGKADLFATGSFETWKNLKIKSKASWPVDVLSLGNIMQSYQQYGGAAYWHDGLDIRTNAYNPIYAARGGKVVNIENYQPGDKYYWEVAILDNDGFVWKYHHVIESSIPTWIRNAYTNGTSIPDGTLIGTVIPWPASSYGETFNHVHMLVVDKDHNYINPLLLLTDLPDTTAPVIRSVILSENGRLKPGAKTVKNKHQIFVDAYDVIIHKSFILPPHKITYSLDNGPEVVAVEFNTLLAPNDEDFIEDFYHPESCGNYSCRKFLMNIGFTKTNPQGYFSLNSGTHKIKIVVSDFLGLKTETEFRYQTVD